EKKERIAQGVHRCLCLFSNRDSPTANESGAKTARSKASSRFPRLGRNSGRESRNPEPQSGDL
ncbi:hypothetical protein M9458_025090, partial [Cirrhinus mrigala]